LRLPRDEALRDAKGIGRLRDGPVLLHRLPRLVVGRDGEALLLPRQVNSLDVLFQLDGSQFVGVDFVDELHGNVRPTQRAYCSKPTLASHEVAIPRDDDGMDEATSSDACCQFINAAEFASLPALAVDDDG